MIRACTDSVICTNGVSRASVIRGRPCSSAELTTDVGQLSDELAAHLHDQSGHADGGQLGDVFGEFSRGRQKGDARGEHQLATAQQMRDVGHLAHVDPAHRGVQPIGSRDDSGVASADAVQRENIGDCREHPREYPISL